MSAPARREASRCTASSSARHPPGSSAPSWAFSCTGAPTRCPPGPSRSAPLGTIDSTLWYAHNPYSEWYGNTIRIEGSPAQQHQATVYGGAPYDDFLDAWQASFDADAFLAVIADSGARYVVPTTKHHDGVALWDASAPGDRNTVRRGRTATLICSGVQGRRRPRWPALRRLLLRRPRLALHRTSHDRLRRRPPQPAGGQALRRLRVRPHDRPDRPLLPDLLWGDIEWPDAGKPDGPTSLAQMLRHYYAPAPRAWSTIAGVRTHWDFRTSEYEYGRQFETGVWGALPRHRLLVRLQPTRGRLDLAAPATPSCCSSTWPRAAATCC